MRAREEILEELDKLAGPEATVTDAQSRELISVLLEIRDLMHGDGHGLRVRGIIYDKA